MGRAAHALLSCDNCGEPRSSQAKTGLCRKCFWLSVRPEKNWRWKGREATDQAIHERTRNLFPGPHTCNRCGKPAEQLHHIDGDHFNNNKSNIEPLCRSCHTKEHHQRRRDIRNMAKVIRYGDTSGIESDFKNAPVGLYHLVAEEINQRTSKNNEEMVEVVFRPTKDANGKKLKERYNRVWYYAPLNSDASWARRLKELVQAFSLKLKGGNLGAIEGKECLGRLREDTDQNGEYRPVIAKLMQLKEAEEEEEVDEDEEVEEEEAEDGALDDLSRAELKQIIKDEELDIKVLRSMSDDALRSAIIEQREPEEEEEEEDEAEEDNYDAMSIGDLRQELEDRELESKGKKAVLIARLRTDDVEEPV